MIGFHLRKMYKFMYKQISPKCDYLGYFSLRTWLYFCIVFICGIATSAYYDVKELIRPSLFSPGHDLKKPNFWRVWSQISLEVFIHFRQDIYHSNRLVTANFWKKNGDYVICTLNIDLLALYSCNLSWNIKLRGITRHTKTNQSKRPAGRSWYWSAVDPISNHSHISAILWPRILTPSKQSR